MPGNPDVSFASDELNRILTGPGATLAEGTPVCASICATPGVIPNQLLSHPAGRMASGHSRLLSQLEDEGSLVGPTNGTADQLTNRDSSPDPTPGLCPLPQVGAGRSSL